MYTFLLVILIITSIVLVIAILMQAGKGGGLAANFGGASSSSDAFMGSRQAGNFVTRTTWIAASTFLALAFILSLASSRRDATSSVLDQAFPSTPPSAAPASGTIPGASGNILTPPPTSDTGGKSTGGGMTPPPGL